MKVLLLGAGNQRKKVIYPNGNETWGELTTLDIDEASKPDVLHDLNITPWPFSDNSFDEIHAYEVLEHLGSQGDYKAFFAHFYECWRILKPDGLLCATVPTGEWVWGDPGHRRLISEASLVFLDQRAYSQLGQTSMTDYRSTWKGNFQLVWKDEQPNSLLFALRKVEHGSQG